MREIRALILEYLRDKHTGQYDQATHGVARLAIKQGVMKQAGEPLGEQYRHALSNTHSARLREEVRQDLWHLLVQGLLVFGMDDNNPNWLWYRLTERGIAVVSAQSPQPYDPDGFLREFAGKNPSADPVIIAYLEEAVRSFNHGCPIAASVMIGAASEKALLLRVDAFGSAIQDPKKKADFARDCRWAIHSSTRRPQGPA